MISGTSKILSISGPVDLLTITRMLQQIQETSGNILDTFYFCKSGNNKLKLIEKCKSYASLFGLSLKFRVHHFCNIFCEDEDRQHDKHRINKICKIFDVNFISIKNMKWKFGKSYELFYFQVRESQQTF